jgi:hypothetical protein
VNDAELEFALDLYAPDGPSRARRNAATRR